MTRLIPIATTEHAGGRVAVDGHRWIAGAVSDAVVYEGFEAPRELGRLPSPLGGGVWLSPNRAFADLASLDLRTGEVVAVELDEGGGVYAVHLVAWIPPGDEVLACVVHAPPTGYAWRLLVLDAASEQPSWVLAEGADDLAPRSLAASERYLAAGALDVRVFDRAGRALGAIPPLFVFTRALAISGDRLAAGSADGSVALARCERPEEALRWDAHAEECRGVALGPDGTLATGGDDRYVRLWSADGALLDEHELPGRVQDVALDGVLLASWRAPDRAGVTCFRLDQPGGSSRPTSRS